jgi:hypothetical protein
MLEASTNVARLPALLDDGLSLVVALGALSLLFLIVGGAVEGVRLAARLKGRRS